MRYVLRNGELIPAHLAPRLPVARSNLPMPFIRSDGMDATLNHADGRLYDSKSAYERAVKAAGCIIAGDDPALTRETPRDFTPVSSERELKQDIKNAIDQLGGV